LKRKLKALLFEDNLKNRALRGTALTVISLGGANLLRLISNLILTRLLFPEAFGIMALVQVVISGLQMFSDIGINTSIIQNKRGDDPDFLNTAWTMQIGRGVILWLVVCLLAGPVATFYDEPMLAALLPVAGLTAVVSGFNTTNAASANRKLMIGRLTAIDLSTQATGILITILLVFWLDSVWALVFGNLTTGLIRVGLYHRLLPGIRNRLHWDPEAFRQIIRFGSFIFLSTVAGFLINNGDRAILGNYISMGELGVYSIGFFLGTLPVLLARAIANKVILPLYRMKSPTESIANRDKIHRARRLLVAGALGLCMVLAFIGIPLVDFLYDPRYALAGPIIVLFALTKVPEIVFAAYDGVLLAHGDSRRFFYLLITIAVIQSALALFGVIWFGIPGAIVAPGLAALITYPLKAAFVQRYNAWDPKADMLFLILGLAVSGIACWLQWPAISALFA